MSVELPEHCGIGGHADRLSVRLARQPGNRSAIEFPAAVSSCILDKKTIELTQRKLRAHVAITKAPLELENAWSSPAIGPWKVLVIAAPGEPQHEDASTLPAHRQRWKTNYGDRECHSQS